jgi:Fur family ferric uptake transcriptional regulator
MLDGRCFPLKFCRLPRAEVPALAAVYRNLEQLTEAVELPGEPLRYELAGHKHHHHHFRCSSSNRVFDVPACPGDMQKLVP